MSLEETIQDQIDALNENTNVMRELLDELRKQGQSPAIGTVIDDGEETRPAKRTTKKTGKKSSKKAAVKKRSEEKKAAKAKSEPEPEEEPDTGEVEKRQQLVRVLAEMAKQGIDGSAKLRLFLDEYGAGNVSGLPADKLDEAIERARIVKDTPLEELQAEEAGSDDDLGI